MAANKLDWDVQTPPIPSNSNVTPSTPSSTKNTRKRYIVRVKNVCMAIPFNPNNTLSAFQKEVISRITNHRKLKKESSLSSRLEYIKLKTPQIPHLIDCYSKDKLCEIATESDMIIFHTTSDDEKDDDYYIKATKNKSKQIETLKISKPNKSSSTKSSKLSSSTPKNKKQIKDKRADYSQKRKSALPTIIKRPHTAKTYNQSSPFEKRSTSTATKLSKTKKADKKSKEKTKRTPLKSPTTSGTGSFGSRRSGGNRHSLSKKKNVRNLSADLDQSATKRIVSPKLSIEQEKKRKNSPKLDKLDKSIMPNVPSPQLLPADLLPAQSVPSLFHKAISNTVNTQKAGNKSQDDAGSDNSDASGYNSGHSGHSGYNSDDNKDLNDINISNSNNQPIKNKKKKKKKRKSNRSKDVAEFAQQVLNATKKNQKRDWDAADDDDQRIGRKARSLASHGRSISLSGAAMLHSGDNKKKGNKSRRKKDNDNIYGTNVQSNSSKGSKRDKAFIHFGKKKNTGKNKGKLSVDQAKRKRKYRYGNRNINILRPSILPYDEEQDQLPEYYLDLKYIHGYDGYAMESRGNLFLSHDGTELIYPMARTGVMLNIDNNTQRHWMDGREPISSIAVHPIAPIIVTGHVQKGPDRALIRVWNYKTMRLHKLIKKMHDAAVLCAQWSRNSGYLYTIGAQEMHKVVLWNASDLFSLNTKHGNTLEDGIDSDEIINFDVNAKKKNFKNCPIDIVSDILMGKQDILGFTINPFISDDDAKDGLIDEFVAYGRKNVKYYEVKRRMERRNGRNVELILPAAKTLVMSKLGGKSADYERVYHSCCFLKNSPSWYILGGHQGTIYICYKSSCLKKISSYHSSQIGCIINIESSPNFVFTASWDGKLIQINVSNVTNLKLKRMKERKIYVPRSGDEQNGLKTQSPRSVLYHPQKNALFIGLRTNQIISLDMNTLFKVKSNEQLHATTLTLDSHYGWVKCLACHPYDPFYVTGSDDSTLRIWDINASQCLSRFKFDDKERPSFLKFSHSGYLLAVGLTTSKIVLLAWRDCNLSEVKAVVQMPFKIDKNMKKSLQMDARNSDFTTEITVIKWSNDDCNFAAGHIDAIAHIFTVKYFNNDPTDESSVFDHNLDIIPWDASLDVSNGLIDMSWSSDSQWLLTYTKDQDLMVWFLNRKKMLFEHYLYWLDPDKIDFIDDPLLAGWDVEGIFQSYIGWDGTDLKALSLTKKMFQKTSPVDNYDLINNIKQQTQCKLIASADNKGYIRVHNYPALKEAAHHYYSGHANQVAYIQWSCNDAYLISVGGSDRSVFQWKLTNIKTDYIKKYKPLKSTNSFKK